LVRIKRQGDRRQPALDGEGPFSPERQEHSAGALARFCFEGKHDLEQVKRMIKGEGDIWIPCTNNAYEVELLAQDVTKKQGWYRMPFYQVVRNSCHGAVLHGM